MSDKAKERQSVKIKTTFMFKFTKSTQEMLESEAHTVAVMLIKFHDSKECKDSTLSATESD